MKTVGLVACSNGLAPTHATQYAALVEYLTSLGCEVLQSSCIFDKTSGFSGSGPERAAQLMRMFADPAVEEIYDVSGGDLANQLLPYLDWDVIRRSRAVFWGYSDLTTILNAIYTKTGKAGVLYQVRHLVKQGEGQAARQQRFTHRGQLFSPRFHFVQGSHMQGVVVGGNIRCFLKLAGTPYFPPLQGKLLLLEALGGEVPQMATCLAQLGQLGAFEQVQGVLLGTFTTMEQKGCVPDILALVRQAAGTALPIAQTPDIGHGTDAKAIAIGRQLVL